MAVLPIAHSQHDTDPANYYLKPDNPLNDAIRIAIQLGKPLLLTGEPGTGKTQLANYAAWHLSAEQSAFPVSFRKEPFIFNTKTYSSGKDLLYGYDAVSHFQNSNLKGEEKLPVQRFIHLTALGQGIAQTYGRTEIMRLEREGAPGAGLLSTIKNINEIEADPLSSVVLIDEIDKAPRDFPNDLLNEVERYEFYLGELNALIPRSKNEARILVIMTSNAEKTLPDAFLRRCIFYHIPTPSDDDLVEILWRRLQPLHRDNTAYRDRYKSALTIFREVCKQQLSKTPATGELIDWVKVLHLKDAFFRIGQIPAEKELAVSISLHALFKTSSDINRAKDMLGLKKG